MSVREEMSLPDAARFALGESGGAHIVGMFGSAWCEDFCDEETGEFAPEAGPLDPTEEPSSIDGVCGWCRKAALAE